MAQINYNKDTWYRGRNGTGSQWGINISVDKTHLAVQLNAMNTKGHSDAAVLRIPSEHLASVIKELSRLKDLMNQDPV